MMANAAMCFCAYKRHKKTHDRLWRQRLKLQNSFRERWKIYLICILHFKFECGEFFMCQMDFFFINHDLCCLANDARIYHQSYIEEFHSTVNFYSLLFHGTFPLNAILKNFSSLTHSLVVFSRSISLSLIFCACENGEKMLFSTAQLTNTWWWWWWWWAHKTP